MLQLSVVGYPFVNPGPVGGVGTFKNEQAGKVEKILKGSLDMNQSPSPSVKIQIIAGKVHLRCKGKTLLFEYVLLISKFLGPQYRISKVFLDH